MSLAPPQLARTVIAALVLALITCNASAASYYVDALIGNDENTGTSFQNAGAGVGPWRTLARVSTAMLNAGDSVQLVCGQSWNETLRIAANGTTTERIRIGSHPSGCPDQPLIDGSFALPQSAWSSASGGSWVAAWPPSVLANGAFDGSSLAPWSDWSDTKAAVLDITNDCPNGSIRCGRLAFKTSLKQAMSISNRFALDASYPVTVKVTVKLPVGHTAKLTVRRHEAPWDDLGLVQTLAGTGSWQTHSFSFIPKESIANARLDMMIESGNGPLIYDDVSVSPQFGTPLAVHLGDTLQNPAHHPNHGHLVSEPTSPYLRLTKDSATFVSGKASISNTAHLITTGALPSGGVITAGLGLSIRTRAWLQEEFVIDSYNTGTATLQSNATVSLLKNWGYFLTGASWMVDSPSEWFADTHTRRLRLRTHDNQPPGERARVTWLASGIDLQSARNITVSNIAVRNVGHGILMGRSASVSIDGVTISHTQGHGIDLVGSTDAAVLNSVLTDTRLDAIAGSRNGHVIARNAQVLRNTVRGSGIPSDPTAPYALPAPARAAIHAGHYAVVEDNKLERMAYVGIRGDKGTIIARNIIDASCMLLDDGSGIYIKDTNNNGEVTRNTIRDVFGNINGKPPGASTQAVGIYLDDWTSGVTLSENTVVNADHGIQIHNAYSNSIIGNTLYGNRVNQLWMQEGTQRYREGGDIHSNMVRNNIMVPSGTQASIYHVSEFSTSSHFAGYQSNIYSTLLSPLVSVETWQDPTNGWTTHSYTLDQWKNAAWAGSSRRLDVAGSEVSPKAFAQYEITGSNLMSTNALADTVDGWRGWNAGSTSWSIKHDTCPSGWCFAYTAGESESLLVSPRFAIAKDQWYRLSFDLKTASTNTIEFMVRRGGGGENGYESLMGARRSVSGTGIWTRHAIVFKADKSINVDDPATLDTGARIDFGWLPAGLKLSLGNVQFVPISAVDEVTRLALLVNAEETDQPINCPDIDSDPDLCSRYVTFNTQETVNWPHLVPAHSSEVIFTRALELVDSDGDGIADSQDRCAATPNSAAVDSIGCSL